MRPNTQVLASIPSLGPSFDNKFCPQNVSANKVLSPLEGEGQGCYLVKPPTEWQPLDVYLYTVQFRTQKCALLPTFIDLSAFGR
jgi:hypothetical protein